MHPRTRTPSRTRRPSSAKGPWKHGAIPVIGLIGEIGGGKSRVAALLAARGALVLDADAIGHALLTQKPVRESVVARFGAGILAPPAEEGGSREIDRRALGAIVFASAEALRDLEAILHPRMRRTFERAIARTVRQGRFAAVVLDAAILLEAGWDVLCDRVVYVEAPREVRLDRLSRQRGWTEETLAARERAQWPADRKRRSADAVVVNDDVPDRLEEAVNRLWETLETPTPGTRAAGPDAGGRR